MKTPLRALVLQAVVFSLCTPTGLLAQTDDASIGKWTLNLAKSIFDGTAAPKRQMRTYEDRGGGVVVITYKHDGKEYPTGFTGYNPATGAILSSSYKLVDPYTLEITQTTRTNGKVTSVNTITRTVSRDRKTLIEAKRVEVGQRLGQAVAYGRGVATSGTPRPAQTRNQPPC